MQDLEPVGPVLNLCRLDDSCQLLLSLVQAYRLLQVMVQSLASMPHRMLLYERISRGPGRQVLSSAGSLWHPMAFNVGQSFEVVSENASLPFSPEMHEQLVQMHGLPATPSCAFLIHETKACSDMLSSSNLHICKIQ